VNPEEVVRKTEAAYQTQDVDRVLRLFDPECVVYFGGMKSLQGLDELRTWHEGWLPGRKEYTIRKTLRAASGDTIAVEWHSTFINDDGTPGESHGGEFWKMRNGRLIEWRAYS
jgi:nuclear transport factor 2 (NTF2) superfamily protein